MEHHKHRSILTWAVSDNCSEGGVQSRLKFVGNTWKSDSYIKGNNGKKERNYTKNEAKKIKRDNLTRINREKINIAND